MVLARQKIHHDNVDWRNPDAIYDIFMLAYDDEELAREAEFQSLKLLRDELPQNMK